MPSPLAHAAVIATLVLAGPTDAAGSWFDGANVVSNGSVSRRIWKPDFSTAEMGGLRYSVGLAIGLRGVVRDGLGRQATPTLMVEFRGGMRMALMPAGSRGGMLVWSQPVH